MAFKKVIFDNIKFKTPELQAFLEEIKPLVLTRVSKTEFERKVTIGQTVYTVATGGLHSEDKPRVLRSTDDYYYVHWDISSFYPSLIVVYRIAPEHLDEGVFVKLVDYLRTTRIKAKHSEEDLVDGIPKEVVAEALKIVINSIYGKFGKIVAELKPV
jgi:DNA polymerase elongation subunit (family B)